MCFRLIDAKKAQHPVSLLCEVLGVCRAGYYAWKERPASSASVATASCRRDPRDPRREQATYGWPRIHAELRHRGVRVSRKRVARLMRQAGLSGMVRRRKGRTTIRSPASPPRRISCAATSRRRRRIGSGSPISPRSRPGRASSTWPSSWTASRAAASAGRWPSTCAPSSSSTRWRWRSGSAAPTSAWSTTPTGAASTCR